MIITPENSAVFLSVGTEVSLPEENCFPDESAAAPFIAAYNSLLEIKSGIYAVEMIDNKLLIVKGVHYDQFQEAIRKELVWDTSTNSPNIDESIKRWRALLCKGIAKKVTIERIRLNDLRLPEFGKFGEDLMLYLLHCEDEGDFLQADRATISISGMDKD